MQWLAYKVTLFFAAESRSGIAFSETDALIVASKQVPNGAVLTGRCTQRVDYDDEAERNE